MEVEPLGVPDAQGAPSAHADPHATTGTRSRRQRPVPTALGARAIYETTKPGITRLVTMTSMGGFVLGAATRTWQWPSLLGLALACAIGTALSAAGANAINQWMEIDRDRAMHRTKARPLPSARAKPGAVLVWGIAACIAGCVVLALWCGWVPALVSALCIVSYLALYTPLKPVTPLATFLGAIPGALPPLIGSSAVAGGASLASVLEPGGAALFILMMVWQIPHFLAIAWLYKEDYERGGYAMLPSMDPSGSTTAWTIALWSIALVPASLLPGLWCPRVLGTPFLVIAALSSAGFLYYAWRVVMKPNAATARAAFFASIAHLPILLLAMGVEAGVRWFLLRGA